MVGRSCLYVGGGSYDSDFTGNLWLRVAFPESGSSLPPTVSVVQRSESPGAGTQELNQSIATTFLPLYRIQNGDVDLDARGVFVVPCWE
jgi:hypothetical protein